MINRSARPVYLDLRRIRLPITAVVSLGHRLSGVVLFLALAPALYLLQLAVESPDGFAAVSAALAKPTGRVALILTAWSLAHHVFAGLRVLLLDLHLGVAMPRARHTAILVLVLGGLALIAAMVVLW